MAKEKKDVERFMFTIEAYGLANIPLNHVSNFDILVDDICNHIEDSEYVQGCHVEIRRYAKDKYVKTDDFKTS